MPTHKSCTLPFTQNQLHKPKLANKYVFTNALQNVKNKEMATKNRIIIIIIIIIISLPNNLKHKI